MPRFVVLSQAKNNSVIMISPEGTRSTSGLLAEFKKARARATAACACACERVLAPRVTNHMTPQGPFYMRENMGEKTGVLSATILGAYELWPVDGPPLPPGPARPGLLSLSFPVLARSRAKSSNLLGC